MKATANVKSIACLKIGEYRMNDDVPTIGGKYYFSFYNPSVDLIHNVITGLKLVAHSLEEAISDAKLIVMYDKKYTSSDSWCIFEADPKSEFNDDRTDQGWIFRPYTVRFFSKKR